MKIQKTSETRPLAGHIANSYDNSQNSAYSTEYTNAMNTYSTDETFTGKYWIDGKKIYRKVITGTTGSTTGSWANISSLTFETLTYQNNIFATQDGERYSSFFLLPQGTFGIMARFNSSKTLQYLQYGYTNINYIITIEYTKTTD